MVSRAQVDRANGYEVPLLGLTHVRKPLTSATVSGFSDFARVEIVASVASVRGGGDQSVTVEVFDGDDQTVAGPWEFTRQGEQTATIVGPPDDLYVVCTPTGHLRDAVVSGVTAIIGVADSPGGPGGSQPGAARWIGPWTLYASKYTTLDPTQNGPGYVVPTGGTFKLSYDGVETAAIDFDATAAEVLAALDAIPALTGKIALDPDDHSAGVLAGPLPSAPIAFVLDDDVADVQILFANNSLTGDDPVDDWPIGATPGFVLTELGFTPQVDDLILDFMREIVSPSTDTTGPQELFLTDAALADIVNTNPPEWWVAPQGGVVDLNESAAEFTNFTGSYTDAQTSPSAFASDTQTGQSPSSFPARCRVSVPLRFYYRVASGPPVAGLVARLWVQVATPAEPS